MDGTRIADLLPLHHQDRRLELRDSDVGDRYSRFNTVPGYDSAGSHAERAQRLSAGEAFALPKRALQGDISMLARRSRPQAGISDPTQGPRPTAGGQYEWPLRGSWEFRFRVHRLMYRQAKRNGGCNQILDRIVHVARDRFARCRTCREPQGVLRDISA